MRRILVENARRKRARKHGGDRARLDFDRIDGEAPRLAEDLVALDEALAKLAQKDPAKAELVKLRFFAGLTMEQASDLLGISLATANRHWNYARAWLHREILGDDDHSIESSKKA
jgi:RNA polymerase sigma factor (TIGR02999 family)